MYNLKEAGKKLQLQRQREALKAAQAKTDGRRTWWNFFFRVECFPQRASLQTTFQSFEAAHVSLFCLFALTSEITWSGLFS